MATEDHEQDPDAQRVHGLATPLRAVAHCGLLGLVMNGTESLGRYAGWRIPLIGLGTLLALSITVDTATSPGATPLWHPQWTLWLLVLGALATNFRWTPAEVWPVFWRAVVGVAAMSMLLHRRFGGRRSVAGGAGGRSRPIFWPLLLVCAAVYYSATVVAVPEPYIDVWDHLQRGGENLLVGRNPYSEHIPDFYEGGRTFGRALPGFPYSPLVLLVAVGATLLGVDVRYFFVAFLLISALLVRAIALRAPKEHRCAADYLFVLQLFVPRQGFIIKYSHTEPLSGLLLAGALHPLAAGRILPAALLAGLFVSSKQYLLVLLPLFVVWSLSLGRNAILAFAAGLVLPWLPFLALDAGAVWEAAFRAHLDAPLRRDSLNLSAMLLRCGAGAVPGAVALSLGALVAAIHGRASLERPGTLGVGAGCSLLCTVFLGPQGFANYYALITWCLVGGLALTLAGSAAPAAAPPENHLADGETNPISHKE